MTGDFPLPTGDGSCPWCDREIDSDELWGTDEEPMPCPSCGDIIKIVLNLGPSWTVYPIERKPESLVITLRRRNLKDRDTYYETMILQVIPIIQALVTDSHAGQEYDNYFGLWTCCHCAFVTHDDVPGMEHDPECGIARGRKWLKRYTQWVPPWEQPVADG